jgi:hypothetical protein
MVAAYATSFLPDNGKRDLTPDEQLDVNDCLDAAQDWQAGNLPWEAAANVGTILCEGRPSSGYSRFIAVQLTPKSDPQRRCLEALGTHLDTQQGLQVTPRGTFSQRDINELHESERIMRGRATA